MSISAPLPVGIIGTGGMAAARARALAASGRARLVAVASRTAERAAAFCAEHGGRGTTDWRRLVAAADVAAILICTPNDSHRAVACAALEHGKHVLVEYPLAATTQDAEAICAAAEQHRMVLHAGHTMRYSGKQRLLGELAAPLGPLRLAEIAVLYGRKPRKWYPDPARLGSVFVGAMIHFHDELRQLFGEPQWVEAHLQAEQTPDGLTDWDLAVMTIGFARGGLGRITYGRGLAVPGWPHRERYAFANGYLEVDGDALLRRAGDELTRHALPSVDTVRADTDAFLAEVLDGAEPLLTPRAACAGVAVGEAAARAATLGQRVALQAPAASSHPKS